MIDERLLPSESEAQIDENFNRVLALMDNRKETYRGDAGNLWGEKSWDISEWRNFIHDVSVDNISVVVELDSSSAGGGTIPIAALGMYSSDPMDDCALIGQVADIHSADSINAMTIAWVLNTCISAKTVMNGTYQDMTEIIGFFPTVTTVYYHSMN